MDLLFKLFGVAILCGYPVEISPSRIIATPVNTWSHFAAMKRVSEELAVRGHEVILISFWKSETRQSNHKNLQIRTCSRLDQLALYNDEMPNLLKHQFKPNEIGKALSHVQYETCACILDDKALVEEIKTCDLLIADDYFPCGTVLHDFLKIPRVTLHLLPIPSGFEAWLQGIPVPLSYSPTWFSGLPSRMSFFQRIENIYHFIQNARFWYYSIHMSGKMVRQKYNVTPDRGFFESEGRAELILIQTDAVISYAKPLPPNAKLIGPLSPRPPRPLSSDLEEFMSMRTSEGEVGVVLVSLGAESDVSYLGEECVDKLLRAFSRLKEKVICKMKDPPKIPVPSNVKILPWIPQNDILGHANTRLFMSHMGHNSFAEAAYHGIPLVAAPLLWEQPDNTRLMEHVGIGIGVDIWAITADQLYRVMRQVMDDTRIHANAARVSSIMKDHPRTPAQEAADHVEWVLRHGDARHLRPASLDIPWYQYFLIDVIVFIVAIVMVVIVAVSFLCKCICDARRGTAKQKTS